MFSAFPKTMGVWVCTNKYTYTIWIFKLSSKVHLGNDFLVDHYDTFEPFLDFYTIKKTKYIYMTYE